MNEAEKSRLSATSNRKSIITQEILEVGKNINSMVIAGQFMVMIEKDLYEDTINHYKTKGYKIHVAACGRIKIEW